MYHHYQFSIKPKEAQGLVFIRTPPLPFLYCHKKMNIFCAIEYRYNNINYPILKVKNIKYIQNKVKIGLKHQDLQKLYTNFGGPQSQGPQGHGAVGPCCNLALMMTLYFELVLF